MHRFHNVNFLRYEGERLEMEVVELRQGAPDSLVGLPLVVRSDSKRYRIVFEAVGRIEVEPEPMCPASEISVREAPFLFREPESELLNTHRWGATTFNLGRRFENEQDLKHYVVVGENYVVHVLTLDTPRVTDIENRSQPSQ
jgi:hypothetical protein